MDLRVRCQRWVEDAPAGPTAALLNSADGKSASLVGALRSTVDLGRDTLNLTADFLTLRPTPRVICFSEEKKPDSFVRKSE